VAVVATGIYIPVGLRVLLVLVVLDLVVLVVLLPLVPLVVVVLLLLALVTQVAQERGLRVHVIVCGVMQDVAYTR
jgi:hypothetical protein